MKLLQINSVIARSRYDDVASREGDGIVFSEEDYCVALPCVLVVSDYVRLFCFECKARNKIFKNCISILRNMCIMVGLTYLNHSTFFMDIQRIL